MRSTSGVRGYKCRSNDLRYAVKICHDVIVPEAQDPIAGAFEKSSATGILRHIMLTAISLDNQAAFLANEVGDEWTNRLLATKLYSVELPRAKDRPQGSLGIGKRATETIGVDEGWLVVACHPLTLPRLRRGPLPLPQGERYLGRAVDRHFQARRR